MVSNNAPSMVFEKQDIPEEGLNIDLSEDSSCFVFENSNYQLENSVKTKGSLTFKGELVYFRGKIEASIMLTCARCLKSFNCPLQTALHVDFLPRKNEPKEEELELEPTDLDIYYYDNLKISLFEPVRDQLIISIPIKPLCNIDCAGLCSHCGQNLNEKKCNCPEILKIDPRMAPLKKLKHLKERQ